MPLWQTRAASRAVPPARRSAQTTLRQSSARAGSAAAVCAAAASPGCRGHTSSPAPRRLNSPPDAAAPRCPPDAWLLLRQDALRQARTPTPRPSARRARYRAPAGVAQRQQSRAADNLPPDAARCTASPSVRAAAPPRRAVSPRASAQTSGCRQGKIVPARPGSDDKSG